jgi:hypothetical protein
MQPVAKIRSLIMFQTTLITAVLDWERRLEIEDERRKALRLEPYRELPIEFESTQKEGWSIFDRIQNLGRNRQSVERRYTQELCGETKAG